MRLAVVNNKKEEITLKTFAGKRVYPSSLKATKLLNQNNKLKSQIPENISNPIWLITTFFLLYDYLKSLPI